MGCMSGFKKKNFIFKCVLNYKITFKKYILMYNLRFFYFRDIIFRLITIFIYAYFIALEGRLRMISITDATGIRNISTLSGFRFL